MKLKKVFGLIAVISLGMFFLTEFLEGLFYIVFQSFFFTTLNAYIGQIALLISILAFIVWIILLVYAKIRHKRIQ